MTLTLVTAEAATPPEPAPRTRPLLALNCMVLNGGEGFSRMLARVSPYVDELVIAVDSRTTDDTRKRAWASADFSQIPLVIFDFDWRDDFSYPRNLLIENTRAEVIFWLDADDLLEGGDLLRQHAEALLADPEMDAWSLSYRYNHDTHGNIIFDHHRERLFRKDDGWAWLRRIHETLDASLTDRVRAGHLPRIRPTLDMAVEHAREDEGDQGPRNHRLLLMELRDSVDPELQARIDTEGWGDPLDSEHVTATDFASRMTTDPRTLMYLGYHHWGHEQFDLAEFWFRAFVDWPRHGPDRKLQEQERWHVRTYLGRAAFERRRFDDADAAYTLAWRQHPEFPDAYFGLADIEMVHGRWARAFLLCKAGIERIQAESYPDVRLFLNRLEYKVRPASQMAIASYNLGDVEGAKAWAEKVLSVSPTNGVMEELVETCRIHLESQAAADAARTLQEFLLKNEDPVKANNLYHELPEVAKAVPRVRELYERARGQIAHLFSPDAYADHYRRFNGFVDTPDEVIATGWRGHPRARFLIDAVPDNSFVLDLGMADGFMHPLWAEKGCTILGVDLDPRCVDAAERRAERGGYADRLKCHEGMAEDVLDRLASEGVRADVAVLGELIEHVIDPAGLLRKAEAVANRVVITTPDQAFDAGATDAHEDDTQRAHVRTYTLGTLSELIQADLDRRLVELFVVHGSVAHGWIMAAYEKEAPAHRPEAVIFCGPGLERWSPLTQRWEGLGGSETAVIRLAAELGNLGWRVTVYAEADGVWDGAMYRHFSKFAGDCGDLFIAWRSPAVLGLMEEKPAGHTALWLHDTDCGDALTWEVGEKIDSILYLSEWHKGHLLGRYPWLDPEYQPSVTIPPALVRTHNGVDPLDVSDVERSPHRIMWASSPDRGLDVILEDWSRVKEAWPDAKLTVAYGTKNLDVLAETRPQLAAFKSRLTALLREHAGDIEDLGRVDWRTLRREWAKASVFLYGEPSNHFRETFCLSILEAQAAGCIPIVHGGGALRETTGDGGIVMAEGASLRSLLDWLPYFDDPRNLGDVADLREKARANASRHTWAGVARTFAGLVAQPELAGVS